jgi:hypothetical protein
MSTKLDDYAHSPTVAESFAPHLDSFGDVVPPPPTAKPSGPAIASQVEAGLPAQPRLRDPDEGPRGNRTKREA